MIGRGPVRRHLEAPAHLGHDDANAALQTGHMQRGDDWWCRIPFQVGVKHVAVIDDHATYRVVDMGSGRIEVRVATRDGGGAKGVTTFTGRDKQLHHSVRYGGRWGPPVLPRTPPRTRERRDSEAGEWLIRQ